VPKEVNHHRSHHVEQIVNVHVPEEEEIVQVPEIIQQKKVVRRMADRPRAHHASAEDHQAAGAQGRAKGD